MACHGTDAAYAQAVVAAQQDGQAAELQFAVHGLVHGTVPGCHLVQMAVAIHRRQPGVGRARQVAAVDDLEAVRFERGADAGHAQGFWAHAGAARTGTNVGGRADEADEIVHAVFVFK